MITNIKKRNGQVVDFNRENIIKAVTGAMAEVKGSADKSVVDLLVDSVVNSLEGSFQDRAPSVEDVQNIVELELMRKNLFDVAKAYIIYRHEHNKEREQQKFETLKKIESKDLHVLRSDGTREVFDIEKFKTAIKRILGDLAQEIDIDLVASQCRLEVYEDIPTYELNKVAVLVLRSFIEKDTSYSFAAARMLLHTINHQVIRAVSSGGPEQKYLIEEVELQDAFVRNVQACVSAGRLDPRILLFDLPSLAKKLDFTRDGLIEYLGMQTLADRYFVSDAKTKVLFESPQMFWMRVSMGLAINEENRNERALEFYDMISSLRFVPSTPTLFNAGTSHPQLSSCYLTTVEDDLAHIFKCVGDNAQLSKWSGGLGNDWTNLRGTGALIKGNSVESQGVVPFLKVANDTTVAINRSGKRRGATCAYLEAWHWDFDSFLELRKNTGDERRRTHDMNTAAWIPDLLVKRIKDDGMWSFFSPDETPDLHHIYGKDFEKRYIQYEQKGEKGQLRLFRQIKARDLWRRMINMLFETGHPWITFKDPCNVRSPQDHVGVIHSSNLCTEITLNTSADETAVCNLGSVNLAKHIVDGRLDVARLAQTVTLAMRALDNVIDLNFYPTVEAQKSNFRHRPVGLGVMGLQDSLYMMGIKFDSLECVAWSDQSMELVAYYAYLASSKLALERGVYPSYRGSKWSRGILPQDTLSILADERGQVVEVPTGGSLDWQIVRDSIAQNGMRNSNCLAIAPTATISNISGCVPGIEPIYKNIYVKANQGGDFIVINKFLVNDLKKIGLWNDAMIAKLKYNDGSIANIEGIPQSLKELYKEVFEVDPRWMIRAAAHRGKWIDQSQSLNIFYSGKSGKELSDIYIYAWDLGLKTTYYLRTLAASQVEKSTVNAESFGTTHTRQNKSGVDQTLDAPQPEVVEKVVQTKSASSIDDAAIFQAIAQEAVKQDIQREQPKVAPLVQPTDLADKKLCRIDNPDCEACQ